MTSGMGQSQFGIPYGGGMFEAAAQPIQQPVDTFDEAAFARAFDEAALLEIKNAAPQMSETGLAQAVRSDINFGDGEVVPETIPEELQIPNQARIGADTIHDPLSDGLEVGEDDPDEIAKTAKHLLKCEFILWKDRWK